MTSEQIEQLIRQHFPDAEVVVRSDDGIHFQAVVVSEAFAGKSRVEQHRLVYQALGEGLDSGEIHAISFRTLTPAQRAGAQ